MSQQNYTPNLGDRPGADARRDAVHIAVAPLKALERLRPGQRVGVWDGYATETEEHVGIVDPFLIDDVDQGEPVWVFLFPGTITGLRHVWSHPAFKPKVPAGRECHES